MIARFLQRSASIKLIHQRQGPCSTLLPGKESPSSTVQNSRARTHYFILYKASSILPGEVRMCRKYRRPKEEPFTLGFSVPAGMPTQEVGGPAFEKRLSAPLRFDLRTLLVHD